MINIIDPYWWNLGPVPVRNEGLPRIDIEVFISYPLMQ